MLSPGSVCVGLIGVLLGYILFHRNDVSFLGWYNSTYPLTPPEFLESGAKSFRIAVITDLDHDSKLLDAKNVWFSYFRYGWLTLSRDHSSARVEWDAKEHQLKSKIAVGGRGMELSDLKVYDGHLLTVDDRTGVIFRIEHSPGSQDSPRVIPWVMLVNGAGNESDPLKAEWMTVKDGYLYVGGLGKEWTTTMGELVNFNPMWVKKISPDGRVKSVNWYEVYVDIRKSAGIVYPGTNIMVIADESFQNFEVRTIGPLIETHGFSAFQFVPGTNDNLIMALKSEEDQGTISSYITVFDVSGKILLAEEKLRGNFKFEGIEFV